MWRKIRNYAVWIVLALVGAAILLGREFSKGFKLGSARGLEKEQKREAREMRREEIDSELKRRLKDL